MPPKCKFSREEIIDAALELTRERGFDAVSARSLGEKLGSSPRPIFGYFESMAQVQSAIIKAASELFWSFQRAEEGSGKYPPYKASGMAYIRFAREERELFKLLFMCDRSNESQAASPEDERIMDIICAQVAIPRDSAKMFFLEMWAYVHGIATMIATGYYAWDEDTVSTSLTDMYQGLKFKYENKS